MEVIQTRAKPAARHHWHPDRNSNADGHARPDDDDGAGDLRDRLPRHDPRRAAVPAARPHRRRAARCDRAGRHRAISRPSRRRSRSICRPSCCCSLHGVSAQLRLGGFYALGHATHRRAAARPAAPAGRADRRRSPALSAVFSNDIVCLAVAPVLVDACPRRRLDPLPFLLALACAANIGSAATLIGNPQNMLIGAGAAAVVRRLSAGGRRAGRARPGGALGGARAGSCAARRTRSSAAGRVADRGRGRRPFDRWQTAKGLTRGCRRWSPSSCSPPGRARSPRSPAPACC